MNRAILKQRIAEQKFSTRVCNCLRLAGIETVEDLVTHEKWKVRCTKGLGKKTLNEIDDFLKENGLKLGMKKEELYPLRERMIAEGWRQCAEGQHTTQYCALLEDAVKAEREACAKLCDERASKAPMGSDEQCEAEDCAAAIRARGSHDVQH